MDIGVTISELGGYLSGRPYIAVGNDAVVRYKSIYQ